MKLRSNSILKVLAFLLACAMAALLVAEAALAYLYVPTCITGKDPDETNAIEQLLRADSQDVAEYLDYLDLRGAGAVLTQYQSEELERLEEKLNPDNTNLRWALRQNGTVIATNAELAELGASHRGIIMDYASSYWDNWEDGPYGYLDLWVDESFAVQDAYAEAAGVARDLYQLRMELIIAAIALAVVLLGCMVFLMAGAGYKSGTEDVVLRGIHGVPGDLLLVILAGVELLLGMLAVETFEIMHHPYSAYWTTGEFCLILGAVSVPIAAVALLMLQTVAARIRGGTLLKNTLVWRLCLHTWNALCWVGRKIRAAFVHMGEAVAALPMIWKMAVACGSYGLLTLLCVARGYRFFPLIVMWLAASAAGGLYLLGWAYQWRKIRQGAREIIGGNTGYLIDSRGMFPDLRQHADELNNLGQTISKAVEDRMNSERFKAELITNVSHDLKTPLTSIINYVDLMKKEKIDNPRVLEYLEVLDRKSQRLKKLTEDLVEASKASTSNLQVSLERLDLVLLTQQAAAEWEERLEASGLTLVRTLPEKPVWVMADGRHLWRVLDNLLSNCAKYALTGTRVYLDLKSEAGLRAVLTVKNISRDPLDIPAERLMERFVRGDDSRSEQGSGLGLSIAQSLTELQGGTFSIDIDGDLFKAIILLNQAPELQMPLKMVVPEEPKSAPQPILNMQPPAFVYPKGTGESA